AEGGGGERGGPCEAGCRAAGGGRWGHPARRRRIEAETAPPPPRTAVSGHAPSLAEPREEGAGEGGAPAGLLVLEVDVDALGSPTESQAGGASSGQRSAPRSVPRSVCRPSAAARRASRVGVAIVRCAFRERSVFFTWIILRIPLASSLFARRRFGARQRASDRSSRSFAPSS